MDRKSKIDSIGAGILGGFAFTILFSLAQVYTGDTHTFFYYLLSGDGPLYIFRDFEQMYLVMRDNDPYSFQTWLTPYFPFSFLVADLFKFMPLPLSVFVFSSIFVIFFVAYCSENLADTRSVPHIRNVIIFSFFSYPFLFALQRANYENILFIFIVLALYFYRHKRCWQSMILLAMAISMKLYPAAFLLLHVADKRYREAMGVILLSLLLTVAGYISLHGGIFYNLKAQLLMMENYNRHYAIGNAGLGYGNSLYGAIKLWIASYSPTHYAILTAKLFRLIPWVVIFIFGIISVYIVRVEKILWKKMALIVFSVCLFPHVSGDYKLLLVSLPLFLFINNAKEASTDVFYALVFILLLIPKNFYHFNFDPAAGLNSDYVTFSVLVTPIIMLTAVMTIMGEGIYQKISLREL